MYQEKWIWCPICGLKIHNKTHEDNVILRFPLFCPKCKLVTSINVEQLNITAIKEPDA